jgi:ABC-2 type transport system ATP-binding protein
VSVTQRAYEIAEHPREGPRPDAPLAIEVRDLEKAFRIPEHRIDTFKERAVHPFQRSDYRELRALQDISFDVRKGEFFGIVGRNGSGKSTLLKILASIYRADGGSIRMAGRLAPFIELGVGFNQDLSARENVILNAVMMGLTPREARKRLDAVFDFAELNDFRELKLKNYSSGMSVRLAFSVMLQADAEVLLIDEVLAVGDASFQQKCADVFHEMRDSDRTVVLVTHDMTAVEAYCHRAMLLHDGELLYLGAPEDVGRRYLQLNFGGHKPSAAVAPGRYSAVPDIHARAVESKLVDDEGEVVDNVEQGLPIRFETVIQARNDLFDPVFAFHCVNAEGVLVFSVHERLRFIKGAPDHLKASETVRLTGEIENRLANGRYGMSCWITSHRESGELAVQELHLLDFVVFGSKLIVGAVEMEATIDAESGEGLWP